MIKLFRILVIIHAVLMFVAILLLPREIVPVHWGISGEVDRFGSKWTLMLFAFIPLLMQWVRHAYYASAMATENMKKNRQIEENTITAVTLLLIVVSWGVYAMTATNVQNVGMVFPGILVMLIGALLVFVSNKMSTVKQNYFYGVKVPWTLKDETVWKRTHHLAAYTGVVGGLLTMLGGGLGLLFNQPYVALGSILVGVVGVGVIPTIYSWRLYRKLHPREQE